MTDRRPTLLVESDSTSGGIKPELTIATQQNIGSDNTSQHLSILIRKEGLSGTLITSAELYTLFAMAATQALEQPYKNVLEV